MPHPRKPDEVRQVPDETLVRWLTDPAAAEPEYWRDGATGRVWAVSVHWAEVGGRAVPVGLDLRSFEGNKSLQGGLSEVDRQLVRRLPVATVIEGSLDRTAWLHLQEDEWGSKDHRAKADALLSRDEPPRRRGRSFDRSDGHYRMVARHYEQALRLGGQTARRPAKYVGEQMKANGSGVFPPPQIRKWVAEARKRGYLPPADQSGVTHDAARS